MAFGQNRRVLEDGDRVGSRSCLIPKGSTIWYINYVTENRDWFVKGVAGWELRPEIRDFIEEQPGCITVSSSSLGTVSVTVPRYCSQKEAEATAEAAFTAAIMQFREKVK